MSTAVRIDPVTGRKIFNTRAAKATDKIAGKGYSIVTDERLRTLPPPPPGESAEDQAARFRASGWHQKAPPIATRTPKTRPPVPK